MSTGKIPMGRCPYICVPTGIVEAEGPVSVLSRTVPQQYAEIRPYAVGSKWAVGMEEGSG